MKDSIHAWLTEQFGSDEALFTELYDQYVSEVRARVASLAGHLKAGNASEIGDEAHALKGMALQIGDNTFADLCLALQNAGRTGDIALCGSILPQIVTAASEL